MTPRTRKRAWNECLRLWRYYSQLKSCQVLIDVEEFKNNTLRNMKIRPKKNGCPFCARFYCTDNCPLGDCRIDSPCTDTNDDGILYYSFYLWETAVDQKNIHIQELAELFYHELLDKYKEEYGKEWKGEI